jgi:diguanylate cyclase (GGDEF)-like protein
MFSLQKIAEHILFPEKRISSGDVKDFESETLLENVRRMKIIAVIGSFSHLLVLFVPFYRLSLQNFSSLDSTVRVLWITGSVIYYLAAGSPSCVEDLCPRHRPLFLGAAVLCVLFAGFLSGFISAANYQITLYIIMVFVTVAFFNLSLRQASFIILPGLAVLSGIIFLSMPLAPIRLNNWINGIVVTLFGFVISQVLFRSWIRGFIDRRTIAEQTMELKRASRYDSLTGIANRRFLDETLEEEWRRAARDSRAISLIMIDVDHFKEFNDRFGHNAGDICLREIAQCLSRALLRTGDFAGRFGGEEFLVVLPESDVAGAAEVGERIRTAVEDLNIPHGGSPYKKVTVSLGVACRFAGPMNTAGDLLEAADKAMYESKYRGRNRLTAAQ